MRGNARHGPEARGKANRERDRLPIQGLRWLGRPSMSNGTQVSRTGPETTVQVQAYGPGGDVCFCVKTALTRSCNARSFFPTAFLRCCPCPPLLPRRSRIQEHPAAAGEKHSAKQTTSPAVRRCSVGWGRRLFAPIFGLTRSAWCSSSLG